MKCFLEKQKGITFLGLLIMLGILACFVLFTLKVFPLYNEYFIVKRAINSVISRPPEDIKTIKSIQRIFQKNVELSNLERFTDDTIKKIVTVKRSKDGKKKLMNVKYEADNRFFSNLYLSMKVDETVELPRTMSQ